MPTLRIACLSQKGGVGKSTMTRLIAFTYAVSGWSVKIADLNTKQKTSVDWAAMRMEQNHTPEIAAEAFPSVKAAARQSHYDLMVFDGRPDSDMTSLEAAKVSELTIVPTGPSLDDMRPQVLFAHDLVARGVDSARILFVLNKALDSQISSEDARRYVTSGGYRIAVTEIRSMTGYQIAQNSGRSIAETNFQSLNDKADLLAAEVVTRINELTGETS